MDKKLLEMLEGDGRLSAKQIAMMLSKEEGDMSAVQTRYICLQMRYILTSFVCDMLPLATQSDSNPFLVPPGTYRTKGKLTM